MKIFEDRVLPSDKPYPATMRTQLWPLCCGARIISGFKDAHIYTQEELVTKINEVINDYVPDMQVFATEAMQPNLVFLTLNQSQMNSPKIMEAITSCGFLKFAEARPRGAPQGFFVKDMSETFKVTVDGK